MTELMYLPVICDNYYLSFRELKDVNMILLNAIKLICISALLYASTLAMILCRIRTR